MNFEKTDNTSTSVFAKNTKMPVCRQCGRTFASISNLNHHIRVLHDGIFKYRCTVCGKGTSSAAKNRSHMASQHKM